MEIKKLKTYLMVPFALTLFAAVTTVSADESSEMTETSTETTTTTTTSSEDATTTETEEVVTEDEVAETTETIETTDTTTSSDETVVASTTTVELEEEATVQIENYDAATASLDVTAKGLSEDNPITELKVAAWSEENQANLAWYTASAENNQATVSFDITNHDLLEGLYTVHSYTTFADNTVQGNNLGVFEIFNPSGSTTETEETTEMVSTSYDSNGISIQYNAAIAENAKIVYAVWSDLNGQDDLIWYNADETGAAYIEFSNHKNYGTYHIHTYESSTTGLTGLNGRTLDVTEPTTTTTITRVTDDTYTVTVEGLDDTITSVVIPTWSAVDGQDDLTWYQATKQADGSYTATIQASNHNDDYGYYNVHIYGTSTVTGGLYALEGNGFTRTDSRSEAEVSISNYSENQTTFTVTVDGSASDTKTVTNVRIAVWSEDNGQDDLVWYTPTITDNSASQTISIKNHSNTSGEYIVHVYTDYSDGTLVGTNLGSITITKPEEKYDVSTSLTSTGISIHLDSNAVEDYTQVRFAVWSQEDDQDDLVWYAADANGNATALYTNHSGYGTYNVHTYVIENNQLVALNGTTTTVPEPSAVTTITQASDTSFVITVTEVPDYITSVLLPTWSMNSDQDDLQWYTAVKQSDGSYTYTVNVAAHGYDSGLYSVHVYGTSALEDGALTALGLTEGFEVDADAVKDYVGQSASQGNYAVINRVIYLDAGHGGSDTGAYYNGVSESSLNMAIQNLLVSKLQAEGYTVVLTRDSDTYVSLLDRSIAANDSNSDIFISIHFNAATSSSANGIETYFYQYYSDYEPAINTTYHNDETRLALSETLATYIQEELISATGMTDRGVKSDTFAVLRETVAPAILLELGYMTNSSDFAKITSSAYQEKMANAIVAGVNSYYTNFQA